MKLKRRDLNRLIESLLLEVTPDIISPGMDVEAAKRQSEDMSEFMTMGTVQALAEIIVGFTPAGVVIDVKDMSLALQEIYESGGDEGKINTALAGIGFLPGAGDAFVKGFKRFFKKADSNPLGLSAKDLAKIDPKVYDEMVEAARVKHPDKIKNKTDAVKPKKFDPNEVPTTAELNKYIKASPPDSRQLNISIADASRQLGKNITEDNVITRLRHFKDLFDVSINQVRPIYVIEDALGNSRAFYKSSGKSTPKLKTKDMYIEIDGFGRQAWGKETWFVKTQEEKLPPKNSIDALISKVLKDLDQASQLPPSRGSVIEIEDSAQGVIQSAIFNNGLKGMGVNTELADATLRNFVHNKGMGVDNQGIIFSTYGSR